MSADSPVVIVFGTDGYEISVRDNTVIENNGDIRGLLVTGSDGSKSHHIAVDDQGRLVIVGSNADGYTPFTANPLVIAGKDNGNAVRTIKTLDNGVIQNRYYELSTFNAVASNIETANNKSLFSISNTSNKIIRIEEIYLVNVKTSSVTGVVGNFEIRRISGHSGGISISNIESFETGDAVDIGVTIRTGSTVSGESSNLLWRCLFSTDDHGVAIGETDSTQRVFQTMFPIFVKKTNNSKTITLKSNEGITIKFTTNTTTGLFDIFCVFTQE